MLCGGVKATGATVEDTALVNSLKAAINAKVGNQHQSYEIVSVSSQVVAGTNKFYHLRAQPGNHEYTITVYIALPHTGLGPQVTEVSHGFNPHKIGHSGQTH